MPHNIEIEIDKDEFKKKLNLKDGKDGELGSEGKEGKVGKKGPKGLKGETGKKGKDGADGEDGADGSVITPIDIRDKLETLDGNYRLDAKAIKNLPIYPTVYAPGRGGTGGTAGHIIKDEGGAGLTQRTNLNFIGSAIAATDNATTNATDITVTIPADFITSITDTASVDLTVAAEALSAVVLPAGVDHNSLANLTVGDIHTQYALLAGRSGGQTLIGGTAITNILKLQGTSGNGTLTSPAIQLLVGNNGATTAISILNSGKTNFTPTIAGSSDGVNVTATMPAVIAGTTVGLKVDITGAGSSANVYSAAFRCNYNAGNTGSGSGGTIGLLFENSNTHTGNDLRWTMSGGIPQGNVGITGLSYGTTTGLNLGGYFEGYAGTLSLGILGKATFAKNSGTNIGIIGQGRNTGTSSINIGGYFTLGVAAPTYVSAALIADNSNTTNPIILGRDNGSVVFNLIDGGKLYLGGSTTPTAYLHLPAVTATAGTAPIQLDAGGVLLAIPVAATIEYISGTDDLYFTIPTGLGRKKILFSDTFT